MSSRQTKMEPILYTLFRAAVYRNMGREKPREDEMTLKLLKGKWP